MSLERPFYASIVRRAMGATVNYGNTLISTGTAASGPISRAIGEVGVSYGIALATSTERTRRVNFGVLAHRALSNGPAPSLEQMTFLKIGADWQELDFLTVRRIRNFTQDEDYNLGLGIFPALAWAPMVRPLGSTESQFIPKLDVTKGITWSSQLLLMKSGYSSRYVNGANKNRVISFDATYYVRGLRFQTLAFHAGLDLGWNLDTESQLTLGESNGLRGYGLSEFSGNRRVLFNIEDRVYVYDNLFRLLDIGAVAFFDSGYVWPSTSPVKPADMKNSVGLGLRVAPSRSSGNSPVRIDVAFPLRNSAGRPRWSLSILAGQAF